MRRTVPSCCLCAIAWIAFAAASQGQESDAATPAHEQRALCLLKVYSGPGGLRVHPGTLAGLLEVSGGGQHAVESTLSRRVVGIRTETAMTHVSLHFDAPTDAGAGTIEANFSTFMESPGGAIVFRIALVVGTAEPLEAGVADKLLNALVDALREMLETLTTDEMDQAKDVAATARRDLDSAEVEVHKLRGMQQKMCERAGRPDLSRDAILDEMGDLRRQESTYRMELAANEARRNALEEQIARLGARRDEPKSDAVRTELERIVQLRERELGRLADLRASGAASDQDVQHAEEQLARARINLHQHADERSEGAAAILPDLNRELVMLSVLTVELRTRLDLVAGRLAEMRERGLLDLAAEYEWTVRGRLPAAEAALNEAVAREAEARHQLATLRGPSVKVITMREAGSDPR